MSKKRISNFRDDEIDYDDQDIAEEIERQEKMIEVGDEFTFGKRTAKLKDDFEIVFTKDNKGGLECRASGYHDIPTEETQECGMGYRHPILKEKKFVYRRINLSKKQRLAFAKWLVSK